MSAYYDLYQSPPDENGESVCLHARILPRGTISAGKFRELVAKATGFSPAILDGTLQAVTDELCSWLSEGWTVEVGELGYFSVSLKCDRQVTDKKEIRSPSVHFQNVNLLHKILDTIQCTLIHMRRTHALFFFQLRDSHSHIG